MLSLKATLVRYKARQLINAPAMGMRVQDGLLTTSQGQSALAHV